MPGAKRDLVIPILLLVFGVGWLLNGMGFIPGIDWTWSIGLAACGIMTLASGLTRRTFVNGGFLITASALSIARQQFGMELKIEVPLLVIAYGGLMLIGNLLKLPD